MRRRSPGFFRALGNHPLLVGIVAGLVRDYRPEPGAFDRWLADPTAGGALSVPDLDLTQRRTHILAAALAGLSPGSQQLLGWISVLPGTVTWDTLAAINPFRPEPAGPVEPDLGSLDPGPVPPTPSPTGLRRTTPTGRSRSATTSRRLATRIESQTTTGISTSGD